MTACSSHPGTIKGAALLELLIAADSCGAQLRQQIGQAAAAHNLDYPTCTLLTQIAGAQISGTVSGLESLRAKGLVSETAGGPAITAAGAGVLAAVNDALATWIDQQADSIDPDHCSELTEQLRRLGKQLQTQQ